MPLPFSFFLLWTKRREQACYRLKIFPSYQPPPSYIFISLHFVLIPSSELRRAWSGRVEVRAKNERVEQELEDKFLPFSWFFFVVLACFVFSVFKKKKTMVMHHCLLSWCCSEAIAFFCMFQKKKTTTIHCCLLLWCYCSEKGDDSKLVSPFSLCLRRRRRRRCSNALSYFSMVVFQWKRRHQFVAIAFFFGGVELKNAMAA